jgi:hypothetical protein
MATYVVPYLGMFYYPTYQKLLKAERIFIINKSCQNLFNRTWPTILFNAIQCHIPLNMLKETFLFIAASTNGFK